MSNRADEFQDYLLDHDLTKSKNKDLNTFYLGIIARQLCELTDLLIEYKEGKNDNK